MRWRLMAIGGIVSALVGCSAGVEPDASTPARSSPGSSPHPSASADVASSASTAPDASVFAPGSISSDDEEYRVTFSRDGETAYFARGTGFFPQSRRATILESRLVDGSWSAPVPASFSGTYPDIDPWVSPDGERLYFSSIRPVDGVERRDAEIWRVDRTGDGWGEPVHIAEVGSDNDELGASVSADGVLWFASDRQGGAGGWDLYTAEPEGDGFAAPIAAADINTGIWEFNPAISADGSVLVFTSIGRLEGSGLGDLFVASSTDGTWSAAEPVAINTPADEYHASFSPDGETLYFVRRAGQGDIHEFPWVRP